MSVRLFLAFVAVLLLARCGGSWSPRPILVLNGTERSYYLGSRLAPAGDVDGDGIPDLMVGSRASKHRPGVPSCVRVFSGSDGELLHETYAQGRSEKLDSAMCALADLDRDGCGEFVLGVQRVQVVDEEEELLPGGAVRVHSGATGEVLLSIEGASGLERLGFALDAAGDWDGDAREDLAVLVEDRVGEIELRIYSGRDGQPLHGLHLQELECLPDRGVKTAGDLDRDGRPDFVVQGERAVLAISGESGEVLHRLEGSSDFDAGSDLDGDGVPDVITSDRGGSIPQTPGKVMVWSGRTGRKLHHFEDSRIDGLFGVAVAFAGDADGDGRADVLGGASDYDGDDTHGGDMQDRGQFRLYAGGSGDLLRVCKGPERGDWLGFGLCGLGDLDGDGRDEIAVWLRGKGDMGEVRIYSGAVLAGK